jgi:hypothetical protein
MTEEKKAYYRKWYAENRERIKQTRLSKFLADPEKFREQDRTLRRSWKYKNRRKVSNWNRKYLYGISKEDFETKLKIQNNRCAICDSVFITSPLLDHNHLDGAVRGLLCRTCNSGLGMLKDSRAILVKAIEYLDLWSD